MNIIVCVKQVPSTNEVKMDSKTNTLIREGVESIINPFDMFAIEEGIRLKEKHGGKVTTLSMGIPSVAELLKETIALGADDAVLLSDRTFAGADSLATSYALYTGVENIGNYDLIICGKQATDGDTAQVGPSLAEKLNIPHVTYVRKILSYDNKTICCERLTDDGYEVIEIDAPAVITVVKEINDPRYPKLKNILASKRHIVKTLTAKDVNADVAQCGLNGSPTQVVRTFIPQSKVSSLFLEGTTADKCEELSNILTEFIV